MLEMGKRGLLGPPARGSGQRVWLLLLLLLVMALAVAAAMLLWLLLMGVWVDDSVVRGWGGGVVGRDHHGLGAGLGVEGKGVG